MSTISKFGPKNLLNLIKKRTPAKDIIKVAKKGGKDILSKRDESGQTVLHIAAVEGSLEIVQWLVEKLKANIEEKDKNDWRPLHCAGIGKSLTVMQYLLKQGASPTVKSSELATPLHYFAKILPPSNPIEEILYQDVLSKLLKTENINSQNKSGQTALHKAVLERVQRTILINELLNHKANVLIQDSYVLVI